MTTHQYLNYLGIKPDSCIQLAFMIGTSRPIAPNSNFSEFYYKTTPIRNIYSWYNRNRFNPDERKRAETLDYVILNNQVNQPNWLSGSNWNGLINTHHLMMILVVSRQELCKHYGEKQAREIEQFCEAKILDEIGQGKNPWFGRK